VVAGGPPALVVHGGAGRIADDGLIQERLQGCKSAAQAAWRILEQGGVALDAVQCAVEILENSPLFNAGLGSVLNAAGEAQLDASIMDGATLRAGAAGAARGIPHPVQVARRLLEEGPHVLLVGEGARRFAEEHGLATCQPQDLIVPAQRRRWEEGHGTVGCVAVDRSGRSAAATSTGGLFDALPGRVGDSALIGCGTYATRDGAVSCTGIGEAIIRVGLARTAIEYLRAGLSAADSATRAVADLGAGTGSEAGLIVVDFRGGVGYAKNTAHMLVCAVAQGMEPMTSL
jgi:beta-aspartyl-peptidase (threonine type)